jgi:hypothetical protein
MASSDAIRVRRIDRQRFEHRLTILRPASWMGIDSRAESFQMAESVNGDITTFSCRIGVDHVAREGDLRSAHGAVAERRRIFLQAGRATAAAAQAAP